MRFLAAVLVAIAALAGPAAGQDGARAAAGDSVVFVETGAKKTRTGVVVESAAYDEVVVSQAGRRTTFDGADVAEIRWSDAPREFDAGTAALRADDAKGAVAAFAAALKTRATSRGWLVEYANAGLAEASLALGWRDPRHAVTAADAFAAAREANPKSLVLGRLLAGLARAELVRGRPDAALANADELLAAALAARRPAWQADALLVRTEALARKLDTAAAVRAADATVAFCDAQRSSARDSELARTLVRTAARASIAKLWILVAEAESTTTREAAERARKFGAELAARFEADPLIEAATTNAEGALLLVEGNVKQALRKFKETEILHFDVRDEAARALWYVAGAIDPSGRQEPARAAAAQLAASYPDTEWANRAR